jgi:hypothetical protein
VLTEAGIIESQSVCSELAGSTTNSLVASPDIWESDQSLVIDWDPEVRKLLLNGRLVKRFKWPAINQEAVLNAFQEEGWPSRIDDPLPPQPDQDSKRRLSDTIKCLNRKQTNPLIHFRGDGTGEGVVWELAKPDANGNGCV